MNVKFTLLTALLIASISSFGQYCTSGASYTSDELIANVQLNGLSTNISNNTSTACVGYTDFTALPAPELLNSGTYTMSVTVSGCSGYNWGSIVGVWIDWDQNQNFTGTGEFIGYSPYSSVNNVVHSITINVPAGAPAGATRMRIVCVETSSTSGVLACGSYGWGETEDYTVLVLPNVLTVVTPDTIEATCYGDNNITIGASTFLGTPPYTWLWSTGSTNDSIFNQGAGTYSVIVTDFVGDKDTSYTTVTYPAEVSLDSVVIEQDLICDYDISAMRAYGSGGTPYDAPYSWDTNSALFMPDTSMVGTPITFPSSYSMVANLPIGFDFVFFGDTFSTFRANTEGFIHFDNHTSGWTCDYMIPSVNGPEALIAFGWEDLDPTAGGSVNYYTIGEAPNRICVINYDHVPYQGGNPTVDFITVQIQLHETSNCIELHSTTVGNSIYAGNWHDQGLEDPTGTVGVWVPGRNFDYWAVENDFTRFCPTDENGLAYDWNTGDKSDFVSGYEAGTYTVTVSDYRGCYDSMIVTLNPAPSALVSNLSFEDVSCFGANDGSVDPGITGGFGAMNYAWSSGENGSSFSDLVDLGPGTYSVTATDAKNCTIEVNDVVVWEPSILIAAVTQIQSVVCPDDTNGSAFGVASGGVSPYTYTWTPGGAIGQSATGLTSGSYNLKVVDDNGCESYTSATILASSTTPVVDLGSDIFDPNGGTHVLNAGTHATYAWSGGGSGSTKEVTSSGTYTVTVTNEDGCMGTDEIEVVIWPTGVNEVNGATFNVYPNPAVAVINIEFGSALTNAVVNIVDVKGAIVSSATLNDSGLQTMSVESIPAGVYTMSVVSGESVTTHKLVISK